MGQCLSHSARSARSWDAGGQAGQHAEVGHKQQARKGDCLVRINFDINYAGWSVKQDVP